MGKYSEYYRKIADLVSNGKIKGMAPMQVLASYPEFKAMSSSTFRAKLREIRNMIENEDDEGTSNFLYIYIYIF